MRMDRRRALQRVRVPYRGVGVHHDAGGEGKSRAEVDRLFTQFTSSSLASTSRRTRVARPRRDGGVFGRGPVPIRVKCASMPWHTLQAALREDAARREYVRGRRGSEDIAEGEMLGVELSNGEPVCVLNYRGTISAVGNLCTGCLTCRMACGMRRNRSSA